MIKLTAADLVDQIAQLDPNRIYEYVSGSSRLAIREITKPEGPIRFVNLEPDGTEIRSGSISRQQLAKIAFICSNKPNYPLHIDRVFSAGGNTRSALETLLAYTPHFYICHPERIDVYSGETIRNLKHIMWCPGEAHEWGVIAYKAYHEIITEVELGVDFGRIGITSENLGSDFDTIEAKTVHTQMQVALIEIGGALDFYTWIARNDRSIQVGDRKLGDFDRVIASLDDIPIFYKKEIKEAAALIDCIWFTSDGDRIPAIIEIEHSTGVTSGLTRMLKLRETSPAISTVFTVVAPNDLRNKVITEANQRIFRSLQARYMPYSTIRELYGLIQRYPLAGYVDYRFIEPFMERVLEE
jgi:type II restriction enzyme